MIKIFERTLYHTDGASATTAKRHFATVKGLRAAYFPARAAGLTLLATLFMDRTKITDIQHNHTEKQALDMLEGSSSGGNLYLAYQATSNAPPDAKPSSAPDAPAIDLAGTVAYPSTELESIIDSDVKQALVNHHVLIDIHSARRAYDLFMQHCDFTSTMETKTIEANKASVPLYMWILLLVLGFNEIYMILTSPLLLLTTVAIVYIFFRQWVVAQWQAFEETGPPTIVLPLKAGVATLMNVYRANVQPLLHPARDAAGRHVDRAADKKRQ